MERSESNETRGTRQTERKRGGERERERERGRESGERNNRGGRKMKIRGTQASPRRSLAVFSSMNSIKRTTDCH